MANLNKVTLIGNLTRDPELRRTPQGTAVLDVGVAINRTFTAGDEKKEETTFVDVTFWQRQAEVIAQYMEKGRAIYIEGRLQMDEWEDKDTGKKRTKLKVTGENFQFIGGKPESDERPTKAAVMKSEDATVADDGDEIPF